MITHETLLVLVADDESCMRLSVSRILRDYSVELADYDALIRFTVKEAETGEQALAMTQGIAPDILLLDYKLPGIDGLEVLSRLADTKREMLTILMTACSSIETAAGAAKRGAHGLLAKPFTPDELQMTLRNAAEHVFLRRYSRKLIAERNEFLACSNSSLAEDMRAQIIEIEESLLNLMDQGVRKDQVLCDGIVERNLSRLDEMRKRIACATKECSASAQGY